MAKAPPKYGVKWSEIEPFQPATGRAKWIIALLSLEVALGAMAVPVRWALNQPVPPVPEGLLVALGNLAFFGIPTVWFAAVGFWILWFDRAYRNLPALGRCNIIYNKMQLFWWLIPVANLYTPYRMTKELWQASEPGTEGNWFGKPVPKIVGIWWAAFVISGFFLFVSPMVVLVPLRLNPDLALTYLLAFMVLNASVGVAAALAIILVRRISRVQSLRWEAVRQSGADVFTPKKARRREPVRWLAVTAPFVLIAILVGTFGAELRPLLAARHFLLSPIETLSPTEIRVSGRIGRTLHMRLTQYLRENPEVQVIHLDSPGGRMDVAEDMAADLREWQLTTYTSETCASACTLLFLAGRQRILGPEGQIGFHRPTGGPRYLKQVAATYAGYGLPAAFVEKALDTPNSEMWYPNVEELIEARVVTQAGNYR